MKKTKPREPSAADQPAEQTAPAQEANEQEKEKPQTPPEPQSSPSDSSESPEDGIDVLSALADYLSDISDKIDGALLDIGNHVADDDIRTVPLRFRKQRQTDCGVSFKLEFFRGGERVCMQAGDIPMNGLLTPAQIQQSLSRFNAILDNMVMRPFMEEVFVLLRDAVTQTRTKPTVQLPLKRIEERVVTPAEPASLADMHEPHPPHGQA